jgi:hypothetical protein
MMFRDNAFWWSSQTFVNEFMEPRLTSFDTSLKPKFDTLSKYVSHLFYCNATYAVGLDRFEREISQTLVLGEVTHIYEE